MYCSCYCPCMSFVGLRQVNILRVCHWYVIEQNVRICIFFTYKDSKVWPRKKIKFVRTIYFASKFFLNIISLYVWKQPSNKYRHNISLMSQSYISKSLFFIRNFYLSRNIHHIYFLSECLLCLDRGLLPPHFHIVYKPASHIDYHHFSVMEHYILVDIFIQSIMPMQNCLVFSSVIYGYSQAQGFRWCFHCRFN